MTAVNQRVTARPRQLGARPSSWLATGANLDPRFGGISSVVGALCSAVAEAGPIRMSLAQFGDTHSEPPAMNFPLAHAPWMTAGRHWRSLADAVSAADGVHIHGIWQKHCSLTSFLARRFGRPYLVSAHGMLDGWALGQKRWKKAAYTALLEARNLRGAACLHALTSAEAADYGQVARGVPVAVIPNGVEIPAASPEQFLELFPELRDRQIVLFLGRLHEKKGIDLLVHAWRKIQSRRPDAHLVLAGPDFEGTRARTEALVAELGLKPHVTFTGMLHGQTKWSALAHAHSFVLPSHSEGLSVSVLEAMGSGVPVVITPQCHLPEVRTVGAGWIVEASADQLAPVLEESLTLSSLERQRIARKGRALVAERYSWPVVGAQMAAVYGWLLGGARPSTVELH